MKTKRIRHAARICILSTLMALAAFSFLAFGSASTQALTRQAVSSSSTTTTVTTRIITNSVGGAVYSPSTLTVKAGTVVKIVNKTPFSRILFLPGGIFRLGSGLSMTLTVSQSEVLGICGGGDLSINVN